MMGQMGMRPGIILLREGTDTSQVRSISLSFLSILDAEAMMCSLGSPRALQISHSASCSLSMFSFPFIVAPVFTAQLSLWKFLL